MSSTANAFDLNPDQRQMLDEADKFARNELYPLATRMDNKEWWPDNAFPMIGDAGYFGLTVPKSTAARASIFLPAVWFRKLSGAGTTPWRCRGLPTRTCA